MSWSLTAQNKQTARRKALTKATQGVDKCPTGTASRAHYVNGCRSEECREAYRVYAREIRARNRRDRNREVGGGDAAD